MFSPSVVPPRPPSPTRSSDALGSAAQLAALATDAPLGLVWLATGGITVWRGAPGAEADLPRSDGFVTRHLVPVLAAQPGAARNLRSLDDHPDLRGIVAGSVEGLASAATSPILSSSGVMVGLVAVFDRVTRDWTPNLEALDLVAHTLWQSPSQWDQTTAPRVIAETVGAVERSLGGGAVRALVDSAAGGSDPRGRRQASEAQAVLDHVSVLRGRLRAALRSTPLGAPRVTAFDLVSTTERAVAQLGRTHAATPALSSAEPQVPVSGDPERAFVAISRALAAAMATSHPSDIGVGVSTRTSGSERLQGSISAELSVSIRGAALGVSELTPIVTGLHGVGSGSAHAISLQIAAGETRLIAPGFEATATSAGTWITLRWPIDLG